MNRVRNAWTHAVICDETTDWGCRHNRALESTDPHVRAIIQLARSLADYADAHASRFDNPIGHDGVLGPAWHDAVRGVLTFLNGESGNLDCGTVNRAIRAMAKAAEVELD